MLYYLLYYKNKQNISLYSFILDFIVSQINNYTINKNLKKYPTIISQCQNCLLIQLKYSVPDKLLFPNNYSYLSGNSKEKINNFASILDKIKKTSKKKTPQILDIGSNDGSFLEIVKKKYREDITGHSFEIIKKL